MPQVAMEVSANHMHNGYHHQAMIGQFNMSPTGSKVNVHHQDSQDDVDLDALVNGMSSFPVYNDERPLLDSMENLSSHLEQTNNATTCHCGSGKRTGDSSSPLGRIMPKPRLDWAWRSKSLSVEKSEDDSSSSSSGDVMLSSSYPERGFCSAKSLDEVPDPFPDLGGSPPGIKSCEESFIRQKFRDFKKLHFEINSDLNAKQASIKVHSEDGTCKVCEIRTHHTVQDVCSMMVTKNHTTEDKSWALIEQLPDLELERTMEDHEGVLNVYRRLALTTSSRFHFRKDFRKYEIFQNPGQFFPSSMTGKSSDDEAEIADRVKKPKPPSLNLLASTEKIPEIHGYLHAKEGHKRSWKKMYFTLNESGLYYSTKGNSKDSRHLQLYVQFSDVNIYQSTNGKKKYHAPTEYMFCTKPSEGKSDLKDMRCFCAEDEKSRQCWLATMRLVKYGKQLQENYQTAVDRALKSKEAFCQIALNNVKNSTERAAIDFSGNQGRVIDNPSEALSIARQEGYTWRKRGGQRSFDSALSSPRAQQQTSSPRFIFNPHGSGHHSSSNGGHSSSGHGGSPRSSNGHGSPRHSGGSPRHSGGSPRHSPRSGCRMGGFSSGIHMTQPWFYSGLTREETHDLVGKQGMVDGMFLVRESQRIPGAYVLSFCHNKKVRHYQINIVYEGGQTLYTLDEGNTKFNDLVQLVEFYQVNAGGLPTRLLHVCSSV